MTGQHAKLEIVGIERQCCFKGGERGDKVTTHKPAGRQQLQAVKMIGHGREHGLTDALGLVVLAGLLALHGLLQLFCICVRHGRPKCVVRREGRAVR